jgi:hypothetical protein
MEGKSRLTFSRGSKSSAKGEFRARRSAEMMDETVRWRVESARALSAPSPATHLDRSLLVLVVHEAQHDGHVVLFPCHLLALGAGLALLRFDLRHRSARPRVRLRWVRRPVPRGAVWNGGRVRESDRPERAASSETGARRLDESAAEEKRENTPNGLQRMKRKSGETSNRKRGT